MNSRQFCSKVLLPAVVALVLQGCDGDPEHTHLPQAPQTPVAPVTPVTPVVPQATFPPNQVLDRVRQLIDLPAYPAGTEVQVSMVLRNAPNLEVNELENRASLDHCATTFCSNENIPSFYRTDYSHEFDGTFLAATVIGGGTYPAPGASSAADDSAGDGHTLGIAHDLQRLRPLRYSPNVRLYWTNAGYDNRAGSWHISAEPTAERYQELWGYARPANSWETAPREALEKTLSFDDNSEAHVLYFSPALFPLEFLPGLTCQTPDQGDPGLLACIRAAFNQHPDPTPQFVELFDRFRMAYFWFPSNHPQRDLSFDWLEDIYDVLVDPANANAIFVVPAGDHGGVITDSVYYIDNHDFNRVGHAGYVGTVHATLKDQPELVRRLNEVFFASGVRAPTNIFAWVPAVSANPTNVLPVVAINAQGTIAKESSQCGEALADYCVAAPGFYFSVTNGQRAGTAGNERLLLPNGDVLGGCSSLAGLEKTVVDSSGTCYTSQTGPRIMFTYRREAFFRGSGSNFWDQSTRTLTLPAPVAATEVAAAITTGALALIAAHFKSQGTAMSAADLLARLRQTADKTGFYSDSSIYGQGVIDVRAAITPQGEGGIALTELARGARAPLTASALVLRSGLFGDALHGAFAGQTFVALDELHSPFRYPLGSLLQSRQSIGALQVAAPMQRGVQRLADGGLLHVRRGADQSLSLAFQRGAIGMRLASDTHPGLDFGSVAEGSGLAGTAALQTDSALFAPWAASERQWHGFGAEVALGNNQRIGINRYRALGRDDTDTTLAEDNPDAQAAVALSWQADFAGARFGLQQVRSQSADELLGIEVNGGLGGIADGRIDAANSWGLIELSARSRLLFSLWHLRARADNLAQGALASVDGLTADSWALALMLSGAANTDLTLRLEQPLRARSGTLHFQVPTGYTPDRHIQFSALDADATPSGRELRVQADFSIHLGERGGRLQLSAGSSREPRHVRGARDDPYALVGLSLPL